MADRAKAWRRNIESRRQTRNKAIAQRRVIDQSMKIARSFTSQILIESLRAFALAEKALRNG